MLQSAAVARYMLQFAAALCYRLLFDAFINLSQLLRPSIHKILLDVCFSHDFKTLFSASEWVSWFIER